MPVRLDGGDLDALKLHVTYHVTMEENALSQVFACVLPVGKETIVEQLFVNQVV